MQKTETSENNTILYNNPEENLIQTRIQTIQEYRNHNQCIIMYNVQFINAIF